MTNTGTVEQQLEDLAQSGSSADCRRAIRLLTDEGRLLELRVKSRWEQRIEAWVQRICETV